ncbi:MAG TPA: zinc-binding alcohol dehydrogenase [Anaerolineaceae bacterium]|nr:zinc-binding alcohol dehydrogenase [Anaerolineaceae bacterium]
MKRRALYFTGPGQVCVESEEIPAPQTGQVLVRVEVSAISAGTEILVYNDLWPRGLAVDETILALSGEFKYPMKYGYASAGRVVEGSTPETAREWIGRRVFSFHPHEDLFWAVPQELLPVPEGLPLEDAVFLPNMETAVNFLMDGAPQTGEQVAVFGQGVVGLLTTSLLASYPLSALVTVDRYLPRRKLSIELGAQASVGPDEPDWLEQVKAHLNASREYPGADLVFELSGSPETLNVAIETAGFNGRIVVGSWYGQKTAALELGGRFHRSRIRLISSQVSTLAPELSGRWSKRRRLDWAWEMISRIGPARLVTHRIPITHADQAYRILRDAPGEAVQVLLDYRAG